MKNTFICTKEKAISISEYSFPSINPYHQNNQINLNSSLSTPVACTDFFYINDAHCSNTSLPSEFSPIFPSSDSYILLLLSACTYCNVGSNEHDPLFYPSCTYQHICNTSMVFVYLLPSAASS